MATNRLLVVDDDPKLRALLRAYLSEHGYDVVEAADGAEMRAEIARAPFQLIILDLMLPGEDGLALCRDLRARSNVPVLMLTARGDATDRIVGLELGADDYLAKPFNPRELVARIKSILRRVGEQGREVPARRLRFAGWTLDTIARHLTDPAGIVVPLSSGEFRLLQAFAENANRVLSRDQLTEALAQREAGPFDRTIDVMVSRLRKRLGDEGREPTLIKTVRSEGYVLAATVRRAE